jgi:hypothetical protein
MRKLIVSFLAIVALAWGCAKHNAGTPYFISFQSGSILYTRPVDSLVYDSAFLGVAYGMLTMESYRTLDQSDSAAAGLRTLATWDLGLLNRDSPYSSFLGNYTTDTTAPNQKLVADGSRFIFYTSYDPHHGEYLTSPGLPFTVTVTQWNPTWFEGTFEGKVTKINPTTDVVDTATITNGRFRLPVAP